MTGFLLLIILVIKINYSHYGLYKTTLALVYCRTIDWLICAGTFDFGE